MVDDGLMVGEKTTPIVDVCLYVPHGKGFIPISFVYAWNTGSCCESS